MEDLDRELEGMRRLGIRCASKSRIGARCAIGEIELLPRLFKKVTIPSLVRDELLHTSAPAKVQSWIGRAPVWLDVRTAPSGDDPALHSLDAGERAALGLSLAADVVLIDDRKGAAVARVKGFEVLGTLGILSLAAERDMVDLLSGREPQGHQIQEARGTARSSPETAWPRLNALRSDTRLATLNTAERRTALLSNGPPPWTRFRTIAA